jgi:hypothetical protein
MSEQERKIKIIFLITSLLQVVPAVTSPIPYHSFHGKVSPF